MNRIHVFLFDVCRQLQYRHRNELIGGVSFVETIFNVKIYSKK
jgi:hypothetical protein